MTMERNCELCETELNRPHPNHANYVVGSDFAEPELVNVTFAMKHTSETKQRLDHLDTMLSERDRDAIGAEMAHPDAPETIEVDQGTTVLETEGGRVETAETKEADFSVPVDEFEHVEIDDPSIVKEDDDIALAYEQKKQRERQKTGLVCPDCYDPDTHNVLWGVNADDDSQSGTDTGDASAQ